MRELIDPIYVASLKRMTPAEKLQAVADLYRVEIRRRIDGLRMTFPDSSEEQLDHEARRSFLQSRD